MLIIHLNQRRMLNPKWRVLSLPARGPSLTGARAISVKKRRRTGKKGGEKRCFHPADLKCGVFKLKEHEKEKKNTHLVLKVVNNKCGYGEGHLFSKRRGKTELGKWLGSWQTHCVLHVEILGSHIIKRQDKPVTAVRWSSVSRGPRCTGDESFKTPESFY